MSLLSPLALEPAWEAALSRAAGRKVDARTLAVMVERLSRRYQSEEVSLAAADEVLARVLFWFPRDVQKVALPIAELALRGALPKRLRILDVGAGMGATSLGIVRSFAHPRLAALSPPSIERIDAIDRNAAALAMMRRVAHEAAQTQLLGSHGPLETRVVDFASGGAIGREDREPYDLVLVGSALVETTRSAATENARGDLVATQIRQLIDAAPLSDDGALIVIEPATRETTRALHVARMHLVQHGLAIFAPCTHQRACPMLERERDWCHEDLPVDLPPWLWDVARDAGLRWEGLTFSYLVVRRDATSMLLAAPSDGTTARLVSTPRHTKGKAEAFACGDFPGDSCGRRLMQLDRESKHVEPTETLASWTRGDLITIDGGTLADADAARPVRLAPGLVRRAFRVRDE